MKEDKVAVCRLCMNLIDGGSFDPLDEVKREMLAAVLSELKPIVTNDPVICKCCSEDLQKSYDFKMEYLNFYQNVKMERNDEGYETKCTFCCMGKETLNKVEESILLKEILIKCLPELILTEETAVCETCLEPLRNKYNFIMKCLDVEEMLTTYTAKSGASEHINLFSVLQASNMKINENPDVDYTTELVSVKKENTDFLETDSTKDVKIEHINVKSEYIEQEVIDVKPDKEEEPQTASFRNRKVYKCDLCDYRTFRKTDLTLRHMLRHKKPEEVVMYKCTECSYQTKRSGDLNSHLAIHTDSVPVYRCNDCHYKTIHKERLMDHALKHKLPQKYKCEFCSFAAPYKKSLVKHVKSSHKQPRNKKMYKCELCPYETKKRTDLANKHMLKHKKPEELTMHKCAYCDFEAKHKISLQRHTLRHLQEVPLFHCFECDFKTKQKRYLTSHVLTHKNPEEVARFKCDLCPYKAIHKSYLRNHKVVHETSTIFKCDVCSYQTYGRNNFKRHLKTGKHQNAMDNVVS